jgi:hypothetical protein
MDINYVIDEWKELVGVILGLEPIPQDELQELLKETYVILRTYHKEALVPKEISELFVAIYEFLYFASAMEDNAENVNYHFMYLHSIVEALKEGFFDGEYPCAYPKLSILNLYDNEIIIDFEENIFEKENL